MHVPPSRLRRVYNARKLFPLFDESMRLHTVASHAYVSGYFKRYYRSPSILPLMILLLVPPASLVCVRCVPSMVCALAAENRNVEACSEEDPLSLSLPYVYVSSAMKLERNSPRSMRPPEENCGRLDRSQFCCGTCSNHLELHFVRIYDTALCGVLAWLVLKLIGCSVGSMMKP